MRYFWTFFWTFLLIQMSNYVISSMIGGVYNFGAGVILGIAVPILLFMIANVISNEPVENH